VFYNAQKGKKFVPLSRAGRTQAERLVKAGERAFARDAKDRSRSLR
jgi:hypothetical protein